MSWCNVFMLHQFCPKSLRQSGRQRCLKHWQLWGWTLLRLIVVTQRCSPSCNADTHIASTRPEQLRRTSDWCFHGIFLWMEFDQVGDIFHGCSLDLLRESHQDVQCCAPEECQSAAPQAFFFPAKCQNPPDFCQKTKTSRITKRNGRQSLSRSEWPEKEVQLRPTETISANF